jgi:ribosomal-protein-alanine N-acetyltransferase
MNANTTHLAAIREIQNASPEASQWSVEDYLAHDCTVAIEGERVVGFLVSRQTAPREREILNVAVEHAARRRGIARQLLTEELARSPGEWFLEVRESNHAARKLYESSGFATVGRRENYYGDSLEAAIVMRFYS